MESAKFASHQTYTKKLFVPRKVAVMVQQKNRKYGFIIYNCIPAVLSRWKIYSKQWKKVQQKYPMQ